MPKTGGDQKRNRPTGQAHITKAKARRVSSSSPASSENGDRCQVRVPSACHTCKRRKTKCSGPPSPCEACKKIDAFCHFNTKLDTRRKSSYKTSDVHERRRFILESLLKTLKHSPWNEVENLLHLLRGQANAADIAHSLYRNIDHLQQIGVLRSLVIDETDIVSLGVECLFDHHGGSESRGNAKDSAQSMKTTDRSHRVIHDEPGFLTPSDYSTPRQGHVDDPRTYELHQDSMMQTQADLSQPHYRTSIPPLSVQTYENRGDGSTDLSSAQSNSSHFTPKPFNVDGINSSFSCKTEASSPMQMFSPNEYSMPPGDKHVMIHEPPTFSNVPYVAPAETMNHLYYMFRDTPRETMDPRLSFDRFHNNTKMEVDPLLRERPVDDEWNIHNWASEVSPCRN